MNQLPTWTALIVLLPLAAAYEQRHGRPRPWLVWLSLAVGIALAAYAVAWEPSSVVTGLTILLLGVGWGAAVMGVLAALEALPRAIGSLRNRPREARRDGARVRVTGPSRA